MVRGYTTISKHSLKVSCCRWLQKPRTAKLISNYVLFPWPQWPADSIAFMKVDIIPYNIAELLW